MNRRDLLTRVCLLAGGAVLTMAPVSAQRQGGRRGNPDGERPTPPPGTGRRGTGDGTGRRGRGTGAPPQGGERPTGERGGRRGRGGGRGQ